MIPPPTPDHILNDALAAFVDGFNAYLPELQIWGTRILGAVTFVGFGYAMIQTFSNKDWFGTIMAFLWSVVRIAIVYVFMDNVLAWGPALPQLGQVVGQEVTGMSPTVMTPSGLYDMGLQIIYIMDEVKTAISWFIHPIDTVFFMVLTLITYMIWASASLIYMWLIIEATYYVAIGPVVICFASLEHTWDILTQWIVSLAQICLRLIATMMILAVGIVMANGWANAISGIGTGAATDIVGFGMAQVVSAVIMFYALWRLPPKAAAIIRARNAPGAAANSAGGEEDMWKIGRWFI